MADFFNKEEEKKEEKTEEIKTSEEQQQLIKVGEKEYTQEELSRKVGLGELADELESKWNTKIDRLYPEYTKSTQELVELRKFKEEQDKLATEVKAKKGEELSPEEIRKQALAEADKLGIVHTNNVYQFIDAYLQARDMKEDAEVLIAEAKESGKPTATVDELFKYMEETGIKNVELAYKTKFELELDKWKEAQLEKMKNGEMKTLNASSAGSKQPEPPKLTNLDSLTDAMKSYFNRVS